MSGNNYLAEKAKV